MRQRLWDMVGVLLLTCVCVRPRPRAALERAKAAVAGLDKASLTELKNFNKPPKGVEKVTACCLMMLDGEFKNHEKWDRAKKSECPPGV